MFTILTASICLFFIVLTGWTLTTYFVKKDSQKFIREEVTNLLDICKKFFISIKSLMGVLASTSFASRENNINTVENNVLNEDEQALNLVQPVKEIEEQSLDLVSEDNDDTALSSFSPEVVEVINEEEEKVA